MEKEVLSCAFNIDTACAEVAYKPETPADLPHTNS